MSGTLVAPIHPGEKHLAAVLLVDTSMSMMEKPIEELNHALKNLDMPCNRMRLLWEEWRL